MRDWTDAAGARQFRSAHPRFAGWSIEYAALAPRIDQSLRTELKAQQAIPQDLADLTAGLTG